MRLKPAVTEEEALAWLTREAVERWGEVTPALEQTLKTLAEAMAAVSEAEVPPEYEPNLF